MSLMGTYRTTYREQCGMVLMRKEGYSINQIARVLRRSTKTVWKYAGLVDRDNRRQSLKSREFKAITFRGKANDLSMRLRLFLRDLCSFKEAMTAKSVPITMLSFLEASKNSDGDEEEDPA